MPGKNMRVFNPGVILSISIQALSSSTTAGEATAARFLATSTVYDKTKDFSIAFCADVVSVSRSGSRESHPGQCSRPAHWGARLPSYYKELPCLNVMNGKT